MFKTTLGALCLGLIACAGPSPVTYEDAGVDSGLADAGFKYDGCASSFGAQFTNAFGRVDGRVVAVVPPNIQCTLPNDDHVVIQVEIDGGVHRLVVNVLSNSSDPNIRFMRAQLGPLPAPAFEVGWHPGQRLDYPTTLGVHSGLDAGWESLPMEQASARLYDAITIGAPLSVYGTSSGGSSASSAHLIHRHARNDDGAIVIDPTSASPTWLLFSFAEQQF